MPNKPNPIPRDPPDFASYQEMAEFWDTHSTADFENWWEPVELEIAEDFHHVFGIRIESAEVRRLSAVAERQNTRIIPMMRSWVFGGA